MLSRSGATGSTACPADGPHKGKHDNRHIEPPYSTINNMHQFQQSSDNCALCNSFSRDKAAGILAFVNVVISPESKWLISTGRTQAKTGLSLVLSSRDLSPSRCPLLSLFSFTSSKDHFGVNTAIPSRKCAKFSTYPKAVITLGEIGDPRPEKLSLPGLSCRSKQLMKEPEGLTVLIVRRKNFQK